MLNLQRQFFPLIDTSDFKKILNNLHKKTRRTDITLSDFKNEVVKMIGYDNFSHFSQAISQSKQDPIPLKNSNNYGFNYSNGSYLIYLLQAPIRKLLGIPIDLYSGFLDEQIVRFSKKKPFLVISGIVYSQAKFGFALKSLDSDLSSKILLCMANDKNDAMSCYNSLLIEEPIQHVATLYEDVDEVRDLKLSHLQPSCASSYWSDNGDDLYQLKRPDIALRAWAKKTNDEALLKLLDIAITDSRFRCRIFFDEFNSNFEFINNQLIKANRLFTVEVSTPNNLALLSPSEAGKHFFDEDIYFDKLATVKSIIQYVKSIKARLVGKYGYGNVSIYILSNGLSSLENSDKELVIPLSDALRGTFSSPEHRNGVLKSFGIKNLPNIL
jgi:hypothetical protein